jgi:hypothetical protein
MSIDLEGDRTRYFHERVHKDAHQGDPLHPDVSLEARHRLVRDIEAIMYTLASQQKLINRVREHTHRVFGHTKSETSLERDQFLTFLEIAVGYICAQAGSRDPQFYDEHVYELQSILADDHCSFRFVETGLKDPHRRFQIQQIDNKHLHEVIVDRTFELTRDAPFASAQGDYADAWKSYSKGDLDDAVFKAGRAVESACKIVVKAKDPQSTPENINLGPLVNELVRLNVIPQQLTHVCGQLEQIFRNSGTLRNQAGTGHGALVPTSPEATVALFALRQSGTLISFLAERLKQKT